MLPVVRIIEKTCEQINDSIKECEMEGGSCALVVLVVDGLLYTVNIGDCRALLCCPEMGSVVLSRDHNIHSNKSEEHRIKVSGGVIEKNRIGGHLSPSRAFGDFKYTDMGLSCEPEIKIRPFLSRPHFILMGTDGIWDAVDNTYAIMFVKFHMMMYPEMALPDILFRLLEKVRVKLKENDRTMDNATIACIVFKQGKTMHEIVELMKTVCQSRFCVSTHINSKRSSRTKSKTNGLLLETENQWVVSVMILTTPLTTQPKRKLRMMIVTKSYKVLAQYRYKSGEFRVRR